MDSFHMLDTLFHAVGYSYSTVPPPAGPCGPGGPSTPVSPFTPFSPSLPFSPGVPGIPSRPSLPLSTSMAGQEESLSGAARLLRDPAPVGDW